METKSANVAALVAKLKAENEAVVNKLKAQNKALSKENNKLREENWMLTGEKETFECSDTHRPKRVKSEEILVYVRGNGGHTVHQSGTYVCMEGPSFSTRAESLMHKAWGGDLIGMTAMPEVRLAMEAQM